jgi:hypothetical protein
MRLRRGVGVLACVPLFVGIAGCVPHRTEVVVTHVTSTINSTVAAPKQTFTPAPAATVAGLAPGAKPPKGQVEGRCPWIASTPEQDPALNVADLNGSHVYRTTITTTHPTGCTFYFYSSPYQAQVQITVRQFPSAGEAHDAAVLTGQAGTHAQGQANIIAGVDAVLYRTKFFGPDAGRDWACVFAAGATMVIVHTDRNDTSQNALGIAEAIAPKF